MLVYIVYVGVCVLWSVCICQSVNVFIVGFSVYSSIKLHVPVSVCVCVCVSILVCSLCVNLGYASYFHMIN